MYRGMLSFASSQAACFMTTSPSGRQGMPLGCRMNFQQLRRHFCVDHLQSAKHAVRHGKAHRDRKRYLGGRGRPTCCMRSRDSPYVGTCNAAPTLLASIQTTIWAAVLSALFASSTFVPSAVAVLNSPNAKIPRTPAAALRRSIPTTNPDVRSIQTRLEDVAFKLRIPQVWQ